MSTETQRVTSRFLDQHQHQHHPFRVVFRWKIDRLRRRVCVRVCGRVGGGDWSSELRRTVRVGGKTVRKSNSDSGVPSLGSSIYCTWVGSSNWCSTWVDLQVDLRRELATERDLVATEGEGAGTVGLPPVSSSPPSGEAFFFRKHPFLDGS